MQLLCSNAEPDEINLSIPEISYPSLKKTSEKSISNSSRYQRELVSSTFGVILITTIIIFLIGSPIVFQIPTVNNEISADSNLNSMDNYYNYHNVFGDKQRHYSGGALNTVEDGHSSTSRLILTMDGTFMSPYSCKQS